MMTHQEVVDTHLDDLRDKLPRLLRQNARATAFLHAFSERAAQSWRPQPSWATPRPRTRRSALQRY